MNEDFYRELFVNAQAGYCICGRDGDIISVNMAARGMLLGGGEVSPGAGLMDYLRAEHREELAEFFGKLAEGITPGECIVAPSKADGGKRFIRINGRLIPESAGSGEPCRIVLTLTDVTREMQEIRALRISEEKYWAMMNFGSDAILIFDYDGYISEANIKALSLFGYSKRDFLGKHLDELYPHDHYPQYKRILDDILLMGSASVSDIDIVTRDGKRVPVDITGSVVEYGEKNLTQMIFRDITGKKQAEQALRESEERYRKLVELAPDGIGVHVDGKIEFMNEAGLRLSGLNSMEEAKGFEVMNLIHPDDREMVINRLKRIMNSGEMLSPVRERVVNVKGDTHYAESNSVAFDYHGRKAMLVYTRDITEKMMAEEALRYSEETNRALLNATTDRIILIDPRGIILALNGAVAERHQQTIEMMIGKNFFDIFPADVAKYRKEKIEEVVDTGLPLMFTDEDNGRVIVSSMYPIINSEGEVKRIAVYARDITEQINAETDKSRLLSEMNQIFNISTAGLCVIGNDCRILRANSTYHRMFGYSGDITGSLCYDLMAEGQCQSRLCLLKKRDADLAFNEFEISGTRDGAEFHHLVSEVPFYNQKGTGIGILRSVADITAIRRLEKELIRISDRERQLIGQDLHDEIGQIMTGMAFMIEKLEKRLRKKGYPETEMVAEINELNNGAIARMRDIIKGLDPVLLSENNLMPALRQLADEVNRLYESRIQFNTDFSPDGMDVRESTQLYYIIKESVHNAIKHGKADRIDVEFNKTPEGYQVLIKNKTREHYKKKSFPPGGMGLNIMKYRSEMIGADFSSRSENGEYCVIVKKHE